MHRPRIKAISVSHRRDAIRYRARQRRAAAGVWFRLGSLRYWVVSGAQLHRYEIDGRRVVVAGRIAGRHDGVPV